MLPNKLDQNGPKMRPQALKSRPNGDKSGHTAYDKILESE